MFNETIHETAPLITQTASGQILERLNYGATSQQNILPDDVMKIIFQNLSINELGKVGLVSKKWKALADNNGVWKQKIIERYPQYKEQQPDALCTNKGDPNEPKDLSKISNLKRALRNTLLVEKKLSDKAAQKLREAMLKRDHSGGCVCNNVCGCEATLVGSICASKTSLGFWGWLMVGGGGCLGGICLGLVCAGLFNQKEENRYNKDQEIIGDLYSDILVEVKNTPPGLQMS